MMSSVISAATLTPISSTFQSNGAFMPLSTASSLASRQMSGQEQDALSHLRIAPCWASPPFYPASRAKPRVWSLILNGALAL